LQLRGVHVAAEFVGCDPELGFEADIGGGISIIRGADSSHEQLALLSGEVGKSKARDCAPES